MNRFKRGLRPLICLTAYTASTARILAPHVDLLLVGDSLGMTIYGFPNTLSVTMEMMIAHGAAVRRGAPDSLIAVDMPYGSYESSAELGLRNAERLIEETGCAAVKLEGGEEMAGTVRRMTERGIAVMGHVGLMPQSVEKMGGFKIQGRDEAQAAKIVADARAIEDAGAFAIVVEGTVEPVARAIVSELSVPVIGIGASPACDGQILVIDDVLGITAKPPRFAKSYVSLRDEISKAAAAFAAEVKSGAFPAPEHCFGVSPSAAGLKKLG